MNCNKLNADGSGCPHVGKWRPVLQFRVHHEHPPAPGELGLQICDMHKEKLTFRDFITPETFSQIALKFMQAGKAHPVMDLTTLTWKAIS